MYCFDCAKDGHQAPSNVVCVHCGVAVCGDHSQVTHMTVQQPVGLGTPTFLGARRATCTTCAPVQRQAV
jgi:hypothetical protein